MNFEEFIDMLEEGEGEVMDFKLFVKSFVFVK